MRSLAQLLDDVPPRFRDGVQRAYFGCDTEAKARSQREAVSRVLATEFDEPLRRRLRECAALAATVDELALFSCCVALLLSAIPRLELRRRRIRKPKPTT